MTDIIYTIGNYQIKETLNKKELALYYNDGDDFESYKLNSVSKKVSDGELQYLLDDIIEFIIEDKVIQKKNRRFIQEDIIEAITPYLILDEPLNLKIAPKTAWNTK